VVSDRGDHMAVVFDFDDTLLSDDVRDGPLEGLTNRDLNNIGATLDTTYFGGLPTLFDDLRALVAGFRDLHVEFFIVSSGILPIIEGSHVVPEHIDAVYACELAEHAARPSRRSATT
jgi:hypothetical protein